MSNNKLVHQKGWVKNVTDFKKELEDLFNQKVLRSASSQLKNTKKLRKYRWIKSDAVEYKQGCSDVIGKGSFQIFSKYNLVHTKREILSRARLARSWSRRLSSNKILEALAHWNPRKFT